jgi:thioredoxin-related protein
MAVGRWRASAGPGEAMTNRREAIKSVGAAVLAATLPGALARAEEPILTDDGLYRQSWFLDSFLELGDDLDAAARQGKRFAVMWELRGCPYCKETHVVNFGRPDISSYVRGNFEILQLNIVGSRKVTDFDGSELTEKQMAAKYGVRFTPTLQFFPQSAAGLNDRPANAREVARIAGYLRPDDFLAMFRYVRTASYATKTFREFLKAERG